MFKLSLHTFQRAETKVMIRRPGPEAIKKLSCSTQLSIKLIMLINVEMQSTVGISTFISMINTKSKSLNERNIFIFQHFSL